MSIKAPLLSLAATLGRRVGAVPASHECVEASSLPRAHDAHSASERTLRAQSIRYELLANNGRYADGKCAVAKASSVRPETRPMQWVVLPRGDVKLFARKGDEEAGRIREALEQTWVDPKTGEEQQVSLLPIHWEEAAVLKAKFPNLTLFSAGDVFPSSSPRSLFFASDEKHLPRSLLPVERYSIKTHLSPQASERLGGLSGGRELGFNYCLMASVLSYSVERLRPKFSPLVAFQSEGRAVAARIGEGENAIEVGAIFRELPEEPGVPGFALFSKTGEALPHVPRRAESLELSPSTVPVAEERILARDAMEFVRARNPGLTDEQAFLKLFVEPLLEVFFTMAREGVAMELHPQNFQVVFDPHTGWVKNVIIRDLHGVNYSKAFRDEHGLEDVLSVESLKDAFPSIRQADLDEYFKPNGELRDRFTVPAMWANTLDFFMGTFFYQLLNSTTPHPFSPKQVEHLLSSIRDTVSASAQRFGFDLSQLQQPTREEKYSQIADSGIRGRIVFRRPQGSPPNAS